MKTVVCKKCGNVDRYIQRTLEHWTRTIDPNNEEHGIADIVTLYETNKRCPYCNRIVKVVEDQEFKVTFKLHRNMKPEKTLWTLITAKSVSIARKLTAS